MKVSDIKQQVHRSDRYSVYMDGKYAFSFSEQEILHIGLKIGQEFNEAELEDIKNKAVIDKGYDRVLNLIMRRPRSEWELRDYLKRKDYEPETVDLILNRLSDRGYVNDADFARRWIDNRRLLKATSKRRLVQELRQKRVADEIIHIAIEADGTDEAEVLVELIKRKRQQTRYQDDVKLTQYLIRQGFNYGNIKTALAKEV